MVVAPIPPKTAPKPKTPAVDPSKSKIQPGDSPQLQQALILYHTAALSGGRAAVLRTITQRWGQGVADQVRGRFGAGPSAAAVTQAVRAAEATAGQPASSGGEFAVTGDLTASDVVGAGIVTTQDLAQQLLDSLKNNPQGMAGLKVQVTQGREQQYLGFAGASTSLADQMVQMVPSWQPGTAAAADEAIRRGTPAPGTDAAQQTYSSALVAPRAPGYDVAGLQAKLVAANILAAGSYHLGIYDPATTKAYATLLEQSLSSKTPVSQLFSQLAANPPAQAIAPESRADPLQVQDYITNTFQKAAGRLPSAAELAQYTTDYRNFEDKAYQSGLEATRLTTQGQGGATYTYDPRTDIQAEIAQSMPAQAYGFEPYGAAIDKILGK
jgi:hypothetical protein